MDVRPEASRQHHEIPLCVMKAELHSPVSPRRNGVDDLPPDSATCRRPAPGRRDLQGLFLQVPKNVRALLGWSEQARHSAPEPANRHLAALGFHRANNLVRTDVENFSA